MMVVMVMEMMMMMMITMKSSSMTVTMATISPLREGISTADFCLPESFSLRVVFRLAAAVEYFSRRSPVLRVLGRMKYAKGCWQKWARAASPCPGVTSGWPAPGGGVGPLWPPSGSPSGSRGLLTIYELLYIFWELSIFRNIVS